MSKNADQEIYLKTVEQENNIRMEQKQKPLIGAPIHLNPDCDLVKEYLENDLYYQKIHWICSDLGFNKTGCKYFRPVRRDGNCFLRCTLYSIFASIASVPFSETSNIIAKKLVEMIDILRTRLVCQFGEFVVDFIDIFLETIDVVVKKWHERAISNIDKSNNNNFDMFIEKVVVKTITDQSIAEYLIFFLRYVISLFIKEHGEYFAAFIEDANCNDLDKRIKSICTRIESVGTESEMTDITALCAALGIDILIVSIDGTSSKTPNIISFSAADCRNNIGVKNDNYGEIISNIYPLIKALFTPGHYDILY